MEFGYFTLSDNRYGNNPRDANHFYQTSPPRRSTPRRSACTRPGSASTISIRWASASPLVLAHLAARTKRIRLAPAVTLLPVHHPLHVAEEWATLDLLSRRPRRFCRRPRLRPQGIRAVPGLVRGQPGRSSPKAWRSSALGGRRPHVAQGQALRIQGRRDHAEAGAEAAAALCRLLLAALDGACREARLGPDLCAVRGRDGLWLAAAVADLYRETCETRHKPGRLMCTYFVHFAATPEEEDGKEARVRYFQDA